MCVSELISYLNCSAQSHLPNLRSRHDLDADAHSDQSMLFTFYSENLTGQSEAKPFITEWYIILEEKENQTNIFAVFICDNTCDHYNV